MIDLPSGSKTKPAKKSSLMKFDKSVLVVIPARGGSKRIPRKNIKPICGQPMIYWPLMALSEVASPDQVIVSTDDPDVTAAVERKGLNVPFVRPPELSDDHTGTMAVAKHAVHWADEHRNRVDYVVVVYPTAVLLKIQSVLSALETTKSDPDCDLVMAATNFPFPIQRAVFINEHGFAEMFHPEHALTRSQDLPEAMHDAGQFYVYRADALRENKPFVSSKVRLEMLHRNDVVDIDTPEDFEVAEARMKACGNVDFREDWTF
jgi:pseudaminic acid cytidylyltransferase